jgi:hypothetical protein
MPVDWDGIAKAKQAERERFDRDTKNAKLSREKFASDVSAWMIGLISAVKKIIDERNATVNTPSQRVHFMPIGKDIGLQLSGGHAALVSVEVTIRELHAIIEVKARGLDSYGRTSESNSEYKLVQTGPVLTAVHEGGFNHSSAISVNDLADNIVVAYAQYAL